MGLDMYLNARKHLAKVNWQMSDPHSIINITNKKEPQWD